MGIIEDLMDPVQRKAAFFSGAEEHVIYQTMNTPMRDYPFAHLFVENIFPADFYASMLSHLPPTSAYAPIGSVYTTKMEGNKERYIMDASKMAGRGLSPEQEDFWNNMSAWLMSERFLKSILVKFGNAYRERFKNADQVKYGFRPEIRLVRDFENYAIGPHTDQASKVVSLLFYLPQDDSHSGLGTTIYRPIDPSYTCLGGPHHYFKDFRKLYTAPYIPNSCLMFFKTPRSFHGVEPIQAGTFERNVLLYNIYCEPVPEMTA